MADVDDEQLGKLFRAAASDSGAPPPRFDHDSVVSASRRVAVRRRAVLAGSALMVLALVGVGATIALSGEGDSDAGTIAAPVLAPDGQRDAGPPVAAANDSRAAEAAQPVGPPLGPGTAECADRQDPALRSLVEQVLPAVVGAPEAAVTMECRPAGERGVSIEVDDAGAVGLLSVQYLPPGTAVALAEGAVSAPTASGGTVIVGSRPSELGAPAPFAGRLESAAAYLAPRL